MSDYAHQLDRTCTALQEKVDAQKAKIERLQAALAALNLCEPNFLDKVLKERDRLRAALKPFAELWHDPMTDGPNIIVPAGWLRDAHHALEEKI